MRNADVPTENIYGHTKKLRFILERIDEYIAGRGGDITVLDFGCGNGSAVAQYIAKRPLVYYGVDCHAPSLEYARRHYGNRSTHFLAEPPRGVKFDVMVFADVLEHLAQPADILRQLTPQLKDYGMLISSVPNGYGPFEMEKRIVRWLAASAALTAVSRLIRNAKRPPTPTVPSIPYNMESGHVQFFTKKSLMSLLEQCDLELQSFQHGAFLGAPLSEVYLLRGATVARINAWIADSLPPWAVSTWYFTATKRRG